MRTQGAYREHEGEQTVNGLHVFYDILEHLMIKFKKVIKDARVAYFSDLIFKSCNNTRVLFNAVYFISACPNRVA